MERSVPIPDKFVLAKLVRLRRLLEQEAGRSGPWAHSVCVETREVHVAVWDWRPAAGLVKETIIPIFDRAAKAVEDVPCTDEDPTDAYARNIRVRIANLRRYIDGLESAIAPGDPLEEAPAVGPVEIPPLETVADTASDQRPHGPA